MVDVPAQSLERLPILQPVQQHRIRLRRNPGKVPVRQVPAVHNRQDRQMEGLDQRGDRSRTRVNARLRRWWRLVERPFHNR